MGQVKLLEAQCGLSPFTLSPVQLPPPTAAVVGSEVSPSSSFAVWGT